MKRNLGKFNAEAFDTESCRPADVVGAFYLLHQTLQLLFIAGRVEPDESHAPTAGSSQFGCLSVNLKVKVHHHFHKNFKRKKDIKKKEPDLGHVVDVIQRRMGNSK